MSRADSVRWFARGDRTGLYAKGRARAVAAAPAFARISKVTAHSTYTVTPPPTTFAHPGVVYSQAQLDYVRARIGAGDQPWTTALANMVKAQAQFPGPHTGEKYSSLTWSPLPHPWVGRGSYNSGGTEDDDLQNDLHAAIIHALLWVYTGARASALKSIEIMNAWAQAITEIRYDLTTYQDGRLLAGWTGSLFARAAEIMRYTFTPAGGEAALDVASIKRVFTEVWWPKIGYGHSGAGFNTYTSLFDSMTQIAVFLDDQAKFDTAVTYLRNIMPGLAYKTGDNNPWPWAHPAGGVLTYPDGSTLACPTGLPMPTKSVSPPDANVYDRTNTNPVVWMGNTTQGAWKQPAFLPNGLWSESGRDFHHTAFGFAGVAYGMETAWHQGLDLYSEFQSRFVPSIELTTGFIYDTFVSNDTSPANWPFPKPSSTDSSPNSTQRATFEVLHHHYVIRKGLTMPRLTQYMNVYARPADYDVDLIVISETLTHYGTL